MSEYLIFLSVFIDGFTIKDGSAVCMEPGRCRFIFWAVYGLPFSEYIDAFFHFAVHWCLCICNKPADTLIKYINRLYYNAAFRCGSSVTHAHIGKWEKDQPHISNIIYLTSEKWIILNHRMSKHMRCSWLKEHICYLDPWHTNLWLAYKQWYTGTWTYHL